MKHDQKPILRTVVVLALSTYLISVAVSWGGLLVVYLVKGALKPVHLWMASVVTPSLITLAVVGCLTPFFLHARKSQRADTESPQATVR